MKLINYHRLNPDFEKGFTELVGKRKNVPHVHGLEFIFYNQGMILDYDRVGFLAFLWGERFCVESTHGNIWQITREPRGEKKVTLLIPSLAYEWLIENPIPIFVEPELHEVIGNEFGLI